MSEKPETCYLDAAGGHYIICSESEDGTVQTEHGGRAAQAAGADEGVSELKAMFAAADRLDEAETTEPLRPGHTK